MSAQPVDMSALMSVRTLKEVTSVAVLPGTSWGRTAGHVRVRQYCMRK